MKKIKNHLGRNFKTERTDDKLSQGARSNLMSKIKSNKTSFELLFFDTLTKNDIFFEAHPKGILGHPDLIIWEVNLCIFLDSNFWHGWQYPRWKHKLKNDFWRDKIEKNRKRDRRTTAKLRRDGYKVIRLWEHQIKNSPEKCIDKIKYVLFEVNNG